MLLPCVVLARQQVVHLPDHAAVLCRLRLQFRDLGLQCLNRLLLVERVLARCAQLLADLPHEIEQAFDHPAFHPLEHNWPFWDFCHEAKYCQSALLLLRFVYPTAFPS